MSEDAHMSEPRDPSVLTSFAEHVAHVIWTGQKGYLQHLFTNGLLFIYGIIAGNVLLLRNNLNLSPDIAEVSQEKLLSLVAERLIDSNSSVNCAIFDLLDIPLYHGWMVDPQDYDTANAIGSKSYNALMGELVSLETLNMNVHHENNPEDCVDFVCGCNNCYSWSSFSQSFKSQSFDYSSHSISDHIQRKVI
ncbi:hypothetical protein JHK84_029870 [Glycine max]|nr:hypothetical protein JHK84_029870 [Glycine max]